MLVCTKFKNNKSKMVLGRNVNVVLSKNANVVLSINVKKN